MLPATLAASMLLVLDRFALAVWNHSLGSPVVHDTVEVGKDFLWCELNIVIQAEVLCCEVLKNV